MFIIIIWLLCGIAAGFVAKEKGRSFGTWLVIGILTSFIGLIIILCMPKVESDENLN